MDEPSIIFIPHYKREFPFDNIDENNPDFPANLVASINLDIETVSSTIADAVSLERIIIRGPGNIISFSNNLISRLEPPINSNDFEPNYFVFIESPEEDFFWRYSLTVSPEEDRIMPWLSLIILKKLEIDEMLNEQIKVIKQVRDGRELLSVKAEFLPNLDNAWATAHVQIKGLNFEELDSQDPINQINTFIANNPYLACSRLCSFRKLEPETHYTAFIVPTYKVALNAFLGQPTEGIDKSLAWETTDDLVKLPIYFKWSFMTSEKGDFEQLAKELKRVAIDPDRIGTRSIDASLEATPVNNEKPYIIREGALAAPSYSTKRKDYFETIENMSITDKLMKSLNASLKSEFDATGDEDPLVTYPVYGKYFRKTKKIKSPRKSNGKAKWNSKSPWVHELNLDFRNRIASSFGTSVIQKRQDDYSRRCWYQYGDIRAANNILKQTKIGVITSNGLDNRHFKPLSDEHFTLISTPFQSHIITKDVHKNEVSFKKAFKTSGLSKGSISPIFRKIAYKKAGVKEMKVLSPIKKAKRNSNIFLKMLKSLWLFFIRILTYFYQRSLTIDNSNLHKILAFLILICSKISRFFKIDQPRIEREEKKIRELIDLPEGFPGVDYKILKPKAEVIPIQKINIKKQLRKQIDFPKIMFSHMSNIIELQEKNTRIAIPENFDPIMVSPKLDESMYKPLAELSHDYILPGIEFLDKNCVTLCEENRRFIEAYLAGLNHEMGRELVWREFPTDQRGTIFCYFWDSTNLLTKEEMFCECYKETNDEFIPQPDIQQIHKWNKNLGQNQGDVKAANLVLIIKGDLIRRYPGTIIYAQKITAYNNSKNRYKYWSEVFPRDSKVTNLDISVEDLLNEENIDAIEALLTGKERVLFRPINITKTSDTEWKLIDKDFHNVLLFKKEGSKIKMFDLEENPNLEDDEDVTVMVDPVFRAHIGTDILFVGFPFALKDIQGEEQNGEYYFILQENQDLPRFGLDVQSVATRRNNSEIGADDLGWNLVPHQTNGYIEEFSEDNFGLNSQDPNSASIADITYQKPVRVVIHSSKLLREDNDV